MRRRLFNLAAALSLVVCVATLGLLAWSCWMWFHWTSAGTMVSFGGGASGGTFPAVRVAEAPGRYAFVGVTTSQVLLIQQSSALSLDASHCGVFGATGSVTSYNPATVVDDAGFLGFAEASMTVPGGGSTSVFAVPFWAIVGASLVLPMIALRRRLRDGRWSREGRCGACGYDLRASPGRCPECGAGPIAKRRADTEVISGDVRHNGSPAIK